MEPAKKSRKIRQNWRKFEKLPLFHWKILNGISFWTQNVFFEKKPCSSQNFERKKAENQKESRLVQTFNFSWKPHFLNPQREIITNVSSDPSLSIALMVKNFENMSKWKEKIESIFIAILNHSHPQTSIFLNRLIQ